MSMHRSEQAAPLTRVDFALAVGLFGLSLALYVRTLAPGLLPADSAEFQTLAHELGATHPTGYPVYLLLAHLLVRTGVGEPAFAVNLFSALMASCAVGGLFLVARLLVRGRETALLAALAFALSPTFWSQALIAEVYTCAIALLVACLAAVLAWWRTERPGWLLLAGLAGGLSLGVHLTVGLFAPAIVVFLLGARRGRLAVWLGASGGAALGVLLVVLASWYIDRRAPASNYLAAVVYPSRSVWGLSASQLDSFPERALFNLSARQFQSEMFRDVRQVMPGLARQYFKRLPREVPYAGLVFALVGAWVLLARRRELAGLFLGALGIQWVYTFNYSIPDLYVYYLPGYVLLWLLGAVGLDALLEWSWTAPGRQALARVLTVLAAPVVLVPLAWPRMPAVVQGRPMPFTFPEYPWDVAANAALLAESREVVRALEPGARVFTNWGRLYAYYYVAHVEQGRRDLSFTETYPSMEPAPFARSALAEVREALGAGRAVYFSEFSEEMQEDLRLERHVVGSKLLFRAWLLEAPPPARAPLPAP
jgi:hypothetical protein